MKSTVLFLVGALCALPAAATPAKHPMTVEDLWAMHRVGSPEAAPNGRVAVFPVTTYDVARNKGTTNLHLLDLGSGGSRQFTRHEGGDSSPAWSHDSSHIAFVSKRGDGPAQLYVMPLDGGEPRQITTLPVSVSDPEWFPDGRRIAFWAKVTPDFDGDFSALESRLKAARESKMQARTTENRIYRYWDDWLTDGLVHRLFAVSLVDGAVTDLMPGSSIMRSTQGAPDYTISPDGKRVAMAMNSNPPPYEYIDDDIFILTPDGSGTLENLTADNPAADLRPVFSDDGRHLFYGRKARVDFYADTTRLVRFTFATGNHRVLTEGLDRSFSDWVVSEDGRTLFATAQHDGAEAIWSMSTTGGGARVIHAGGGIGSLSLGPRATLLFTRTDLSTPPEIHSLSRRGTRLTRLTGFNAERLGRIDFGRVERVTFTGARGETVQAWVVYPPGFDASKRWPLLNVLHGGPHGITADSFHFRWNLQLFAAPGYVVIAPNFHGSTSFGQAFAESIHGDHATLPFADAMAATDFMLERGFIDESRMAAAGGSYGGYLVSWIAGHTDRYAALINHAGVYNLMDQYASDATKHREAAYGATPWSDVERLNLYNPAHYAADFKTPMLVLHGERDFRVPVTQGLQVYGVYKAMGLPARLVHYPDENHWILKPQNSVHWFGEFHGWLERWVGAGPTE